MRTDPYGWSHQEFDPGFYLTNWLGRKLATLVVLVVLYLCVRYQLTVHATPVEVDFAMAHAKSKVLLALWFDPYAKLVFHTEYGTLDFYRYTCAHAGFFIECWQKVLELIQRGAVTAVLVIAAPPVFLRLTILVWEIWQEQRLRALTAPRPVRPDLAEEHLANVGQAATEIPDTLPSPKPVVTRPQSLPVPEPDTETLPVPIVPARLTPKPRRARKQDSSDKPEAVTQTTSKMQPGQLRKRRKPKA